jgi:hypothetical protein
MASASIPSIMSAEIKSRNREIGRYAGCSTALDWLALTNVFSRVWNYAEVYPSTQLAYHRATRTLPNFGLGKISRPLDPSDQFSRFQAP